jgi:hypothetical protein
VLAALVGCQHEPARVTKTAAETVWHGFGKPGPGKIAVTVRGDVKHPGCYYLEQGASLESLPYSFGGWGGRSDMIGRPSKAYISGSYRSVKIIYLLKRLTKEEREAVKLEDGDLVEYPVDFF